MSAYKQDGDNFSEGITEAVTGAMRVMFGNNSNFGMDEHDHPER